MGRHAPDADQVQRSFVDHKGRPVKRKNLDRIWKVVDQLGEQARFSGQ